MFGKNKVSLWLSCNKLMLGEIFVAISTVLSIAVKVEGKD